METLEGNLPDGSSVPLFTLTCATGAQAHFIGLGAALVGFEVPDKNGVLIPVACGFAKVSDYLESDTCMGAIIGRYANRIGRAHFQLGGKTFELEANEGANCLHSGKSGFHHQAWKLEFFRQSHHSSFVEFSHFSPDGEGGFPGNVQTRVRYTLRSDGALRLDIAATTDAPTVLNIVHHPYFNLTGDFSKSCLDHRLQIEADTYTPTDEVCLPTGAILPVAHTPFDFRNRRRIGEAIEAQAPELQPFGGYDVNFALREAVLTPLRRVATLTDESSGRSLEISTTQPGMQLYSGNGFDGNLIGTGGAPLKAHSAIAMEAQHFPDAPNKPDFPSVVYGPDKPFHSQTVYRVKHSAGYSQ